MLGACASAMLMLPELAASPLIGRRHGRACRGGDRLCRHCARARDRRCRKRDRVDESRARDPRRSPDRRRRSPATRRSRPASASAREAEAGDLVEVGAGLARRDVEGGVPVVGGPMRFSPGRRPCATSPTFIFIVARRAAGSSSRAPCPTLASKRTVIVARRRSRPERRVGALRGAAIAGDLAEQAVERHRGKGHADHAGDEDGAGRGGDADTCLAARRPIGSHRCS